MLNKLFILLIGIAFVGCGTDEVEFTKENIKGNWYSCEEDYGYSEHHFKDKHFEYYSESLDVDFLNGYYIKEDTLFFYGVDKDDINNFFIIKSITKNNLVFTTKTSELKLTRINEDIEERIFHDENGEYDMKAKDDFLLKFLDRKIKHGCQYDYINNSEDGILQAEEENEYLSVNVMGDVVYENKDKASNYQILILIDGDTIESKVHESSKFDIPLALGKKYYFGFKKEGYSSKHLIVDVIDCGGYENSKYGFTIPLELKLIKGNSAAPSKEVAYFRYYTETGYVSHRLDSNLMN